MPTNHRQTRIETYFNLSSQIAQIDTAQLRSLWDASEAQTGWGSTHTVTIGQSKVFVKRVPVTNIEYENMFSTKNLYDLPIYYHYGVGSAGFGVFREIITHIKTTNWVLQDAIATFPLLYHYRIVPWSGSRAAVDAERHRRYVEYWGSNPNIARYMLDRANASYEAILCLEYIPYTVAPWLLENPGKLPMIMADMGATIAWLRKNGMIHLDPHFFNIVTDGKRAYLADFGLVLDKRFALTPAEELFYRQHTDYDYGELLWSLGVYLVRMYQRLPEADKQRLSATFGVPDGVESEELMTILLNHLDQNYVCQILKVDRSYAVSILKYRSIIALMHAFYADMRKNPKKDTRFHHTRLRRLLKEAGILPDTRANGGSTAPRI